MHTHTHIHTNACACTHAHTHTQMRACTVHVLLCWYGRGGGWGKKSKEGRVGRWQEQSNGEQNQPTKVNELLSFYCKNWAQYLVNTKLTSQQTKTKYTRLDRQTDRPTNTVTCRYWCQPNVPQSNNTKSAMVIEVQKRPVIQRMHANSRTHL